MEIKITTQQILKVLQILSWIIFIGLCIEAGTIVANTFFALVINPEGTENYWEGADYLSSLYKYDYGHFLALTITMIIVAVIKAFMFYSIVNLFTRKNLNMSQPFNLDLRRFILKLSYFAFAIGLFSYYGFKYSVWLSQQGLKTADLSALNLAGADVWLFMGVILFVIVQIVKRGIEIQNENDLTI